MPIIQGAQTSAYNLAQENMKVDVLGALEGDPTHRALSADERAQYQAAVNNGQFGLAIRIQLKAAGQTAPQIQEIAQKATTKAQEDVDLIAELNKAMEILGSNGKKPTGGGGAKSGPNTLEEVDEALRTGPTKDIDALLKQRDSLTT